ncbi:helix-turn-helix transcriptional regulator [Gemmatimonas sp.]|uniref:helix-turn-helix transcriptional regulator n=1 Tax=Gemmatimonas sp. TaxID=1962908 RepID=UPI0033425785
MYDNKVIHRAVREARQAAYLTQRELADRVGTSQSAVAALERGDGNPTVETLARLAAAVGMQLQVTLTPVAPPDPVVALYKQGVDRTLLRQNLRRSVDERLRTLGEWQENGRALAEATARARRARLTPPGGNP